MIVEFDSVEAVSAEHKKPGHAEGLRVFGACAERDLRIIDGGVRPGRH